MNLFQALKMSCRDATYLHGKEKESKLTFSEWAGLKFHLLYCGLCRLFFRQLDDLENRAHIFSHEHDNSSLAPASKEKMKQALRKEIEK